MCNFIENFVVGIISGCLSSAIITIIFTRMDKKEKQRKGFLDDIQTFHRWIERIRNELEIAYKYKDTSFLKRVIENEPVLHFFNGLSSESFSLKQETTKCIYSLVDKYDSREVSENQFKADMGMLFKYSVESLKYRKD